MPFIGKQPEVGAYQLIDSITTSATATYALTVDGSAYFPASARNLIVSLNGVTQAPESAYTVSGSNIVFDSALTASDVIDYIMVIGDAVDIGTPSDGTVGTSQMSYPLGNFSSTGIDDNATSTAITIDASEQVGIGDAAPDVKLKIKGGAGTIEPQVTIESTAFNAGQGTALNFSRAGFDQPIQARISAVDNGVAGSNFIFSTKVDGTAGALTERMRIDSSGRVGIGDASPDAGLTVHNNAGAVIATSNIARQTYTGVGNLQVSTANSGGILIHTENTASSGFLGFGDGQVAGRIEYQHSVDKMTFMAGANIRMTLDSVGNLLVGKTDATDGVVGLTLSPTRPWVSNASSSNSVHAWGVYDTSTPAYRFYVGFGGTIFATSASISAISDASLKENVRDLDKGLDTILALKPRRFDWKNGDGNDIMGFIAQEVDEVLPELVHDYMYNEDETKLSLKMGDMIPSLVKAIQEQQAMIETLQAQVAELQGAN